MSVEAWFTLAVTITTVAVMVRGLFPPAAAMFGAAVVLLLAGITEPEQALAGFSNPAPLTVAALYVVASQRRTPAHWHPRSQRSSVAAVGTDAPPPGCSFRQLRALRSSTTRRSWRCSLRW